MSSFWAIVDVSLLMLTILVSSDSLIRLGPVQSLVWALCYGLLLLRAGTLATIFVPVVLRNTAMFAYPAACIVSVLWSVSPLTSLVSAIQLLMTVLIATYLGWRYSLAALTKAVFIVLTFAIILSLLHWATHVFPWEVYSYAGGLVGVFSQKNMLGQRCLFALIVIMAIWLLPRSQVTGRFRLAALMALVLVLLALALSKSITTVLLAPALLGLFALICVQYIPPLVVALLAGATILSFALGPVLLSAAGIEPIEAILTAVGKDATLTGRTVLWQIAAGVWGQNMPMGIGYGAFWKSAAFVNERLITESYGENILGFHNFVLEILVGTGLAGIAAMFLLIGTAAFRLLWVFRTRSSIGAACGLVLLVGALTASMLGPSLYRGHEFMLILIVMYAVSAGEEARGG